MKEQRRREVRDDSPLVLRSEFTVHRSWSILVGLALLMLVSYSVLRGGWASTRGNETTADRAVFTIANAVSLSGFRITVNPDDFKPAGQVTIFLLMACGTLATLIVGGWALVRVLDISFGDDQIVRALDDDVGAGDARRVGGAVGAKGLDSAAFQSAAAFGNCGLVLGRLPA